jgi:hypothetical protein
MTGLLGGRAYTMNQASHDLARLRVDGVVTGISGKNRYRLASDGCGLRSSRPTSTTGCCSPCSPPAGHPHHRQKPAEISRRFSNTLRPSFATRRFARNGSRFPERQIRQTPAVRAARGA